jgi:iron complex outermembrane recepter protein
MRKKKYINLSFATSLLLTGFLYAKDVTSLETITVTAQKSEEDVQKVPINMDVFDAMSLEDKSISDLSDIAKYTPNLLMFNTGTQSLVIPSIRGISAGVVSYSSPVSLYVDGVPTMSAFGFSDALGDIERIEVLKGPQGTLYGKNSESGVINIITKKPDNEIKGKLFSTLGTDGKKEVGLNVSGPIVENKFYAGVSYKHNEKDGYIKHSLTGEEVNSKESDYGKLHLRYTPTDNLDVSLISSINKTKDGDSDWALAGQNLDKVSVSSNIGYANTTTKTLALNVDYDIDNTTKIKSITTKRVYTEDVVTDMDLSDSTIRHSFRDYEFDTLSQELRVEKEIGDSKVVSGIYTDKEKNDISLVMKTQMDPTGASSKPQHLTSQTYSFFTNVIHPLSEKWIINGGIRYDKEKKDTKVTNTNIFIENEWENISPKISLQYDIDNNSMTYATVAKGYRSGGFNPYASTDNYKSYDEESLISYELGYKSVFFDNRVKINSSIYYMDIDDMQVQIMPTPGTAYMVNAASATSKGIEFDMEALLSNEITLSSGFGYNKTTFDKFIDGNNDYSGNYNLHAPKYNFNIGVQYRNELGYYARADINGYGKTYFDSANKYSQKAYELVDTKIGYETNDYDIYLYVNNLFDKEHHATNAYMNGTVTTYNQDREVGVKLAYRF